MSDRYSEDGIDHDLEAAVESLCLKINSPDTALFLEKLIPALEYIMAKSRNDGYCEGMNDVMRKLQEAGGRVK